MRLRMLWYQFRMLTIRDGVKRTAYLKKRNVYAGIGENVMIQSRKIPLYPELIRIGNNVRMASNVLFVTHDVVHNMLNRISPKTEKILVGGVFHEKVGCIEIGNNVFIGTGSIILYDTNLHKIRELLHRQDKKRGRHTIFSLSLGALCHNFINLEVNLKNPQYGKKENGCRPRRPQRYNLSLYNVA